MQLETHLAKAIPQQEPPQRILAAEEVQEQLVAQKPSKPYQQVAAVIPLELGPQIQSHGQQQMLEQTKI